MQKTRDRYESALKEINESNAKYMEGELKLKSIINILLIYYLYLSFL